MQFKLIVRVLMVLFFDLGRVGEIVGIDETAYFDTQGDGIDFGKGRKGGVLNSFSQNSRESDGRGVEKNGVGIKLF